MRTEITRAIPIDGSVLRLMAKTSAETSWVTTDEAQEIPQLLDLKRDSFVLEIGCGSGEICFGSCGQIRLPDRGTGY